jgi:hypothetical protein
MSGAAEQDRLYVVQRWFVIRTLAPVHQMREAAVTQSIYGLGYGLDDRRSIPITGWDVFLLNTAFILALGPSQPPTQWVLGDLSPGVKRPWRETDRTPLPSVEVKNAWSYTSTPQIRLHGMVLKLRKGTTLSFTRKCVANRGKVARPENIDLKGKVPCLPWILEKT